MLERSNTGKIFDTRGNRSPSSASKANNSNTEERTGYGRINNSNNHDTICYNNNNNRTYNPLLREGRKKGAAQSTNGNNKLQPSRRRRMGAPICLMQWNGRSIKKYKVTDLKDMLRRYLPDVVTLCEVMDISQESISQIAELGYRIFHLSMRRRFLQLLLRHLEAEGLEGGVDRRPKERDT